MADEVDYESDTAMAEEEEDDVYPMKKGDRANGSKRISDTNKSRVVKGRGKGRAAMDSERYPADSGVFDKLSDGAVGNSRDRDHGNAVKSVEGWILFVTGVHEEATEEHLLDAFGEESAVKNLHMNLDRHTGFVKGYALIEFEKFEAAKGAIERLDGEEMLGQTIHVDWAFRKGNTIQSISHSSILSFQYYCRFNR